jgi:hypothetical protein
MQPSGDHVKFSGLGHRLPAVLNLDLAVDGWACHLSVPSVMDRASPISLLLISVANGRKISNSRLFNTSEVSSRLGKALISLVELISRAKARHQHPQHSLPLVNKNSDIPFLNCQLNRQCPFACFRA